MHAYISWASLPFIQLLQQVQKIIFITAIEYKFGCNSFNAQLPHHVSCQNCMLPPSPITNVIHKFNANHPYNPPKVTPWMLDNLHCPFTPSFPILHTNHSLQKWFPSSKMPQPFPQIRIDWWCLIFSPPIPLLIGEHIVFHSTRWNLRNSPLSPPLRKLFPQLWGPLVESLLAMPKNLKGNHNNKWHF